MARGGVYTEVAALLDRTIKDANEMGIAKPI